MKIVPIWDYTTNRDSATSEGTLDKPSMLPVLQEDTNYLGLGMRYNMVFDEVLDLANYDYYLDIQFRNAYTRVGVYRENNQTYNWTLLNNIGEGVENSINTVKLYYDGNDLLVDWHEKTAIIARTIDPNTARKIALYGLADNGNDCLYMIRKVPRNGGGGQPMKTKYYAISNTENWNYINITEEKTFLKRNTRTVLLLPLNTDGTMEYTIQTTKGEGSIFGITKNKQRITEQQHTVELTNSNGYNPNQNNTLHITFQDGKPTLRINNEQPTTQNTEYTEAYIYFYQTNTSQQLEIQTIKETNTTEEE